MRLEEREIPLEELFLDEQNPRLADQLAQTGILHRFASDRKTRALAAHIVGYGLSPLDRTAVTPHSELPGRYVVLEGNRRVAAMKLLHHPKSAGSAETQYTRLAAQAAAEIPQLVRCVVFNSAEQADVWIRLRHSGEAGGAGLVAWNAQQTARYNERRGRKDQHLRSLNLLNEAVEKGWITDDERKQVKLTHLTRLVKDTRVQKRLGVTFTPEQKLDLGPRPAEAKATLQAILLKLPSTPVRTIYGVDERQAFLNGIFESLVGNHPTTTPGKTATGRPGRQHAGLSQQGPERRTMIPPDDPIRLRASTRSYDLCGELKRLDVHEFPNCAVIAFRSLFELIIRQYLVTKNLPANDMDKLKTLTTRVLDDLAAKQTATKETMQPIRKALSDEGHPLNPSTMHYFVHSKLAFPDPRGLIRLWESMGPFLRAVCNEC